VRGTETAKLVLEYLKVLLSAPVVGGVVAIISLIYLGKEIKALIQRIAKIRLPGGSEVSTSQIEKTSEVPAGSSNPPSLIDESPVPQNPNPTAQDFQNLKQLFDAERIRAFIWEYRYLNFFLVRHTQQFLDWLIRLQSPTSVPLADAHWMQVVPDPNERRAVLDALLTHHLIQLNGELIEVTPKGREYVHWRGQLPVIPS
jgi:hypothetical protein